MFNFYLHTDIADSSKSTPIQRSLYQAFQQLLPLSYKTTKHISDIACSTAARGRFQQPLTHLSAS